MTRNWRLGGYATKKSSSLLTLDTKNLNTKTFYSLREEMTKIMLPADKTFCQVQIAREINQKRGCGIFITSISEPELVCQSSQLVCFLQILWLIRKINQL